MKKVYIVTMTIDSEDGIQGVYATLEGARERAEDLAEYMGVEEDTEDRDDFWGYDEANCIFITDHDVL